jgi:four helix bundle protein
MIRNFTDLEAWRVSHRLVMEVYLLTKKYPKDELFALTSQSRRAAVSAAANIAEGFGRNTRPDKIHFYAMARSSLIELQSHLLIGRDLGFISDKECTDCIATAEWAAKLINGLERAAPDKRP